MMLVMAASVWRSRAPSSTSHSSRQVPGRKFSRCGHDQRTFRGDFDGTALTRRVSRSAQPVAAASCRQAVQRRAGMRSPPFAGRWVGDEAGHATSSIASHGATARAVGVSPANVVTSRWRWDWST
ncbi:hypothetical protein Sros_8640 [Streptosporangium roseum DSM 43021]|uniref:Uncharacterized protein n=1 Tax=Streptosporangium roseum (strain ATCC 12428 / DSM 43021 / JCM 3005 / KCTC 9067 / NCIMB 10171 / NRRL 2505 / NI 9100) TaxID=479432 RepID=D2B448_STRRD|nr:hypothetical protein Sros_8640 [Streptosporangium roseum DSM 43021]